MDAGTPTAASGARDLRRITAAIVVSALGTWSYNVAIAVYAYQQTQSTAWVAVATVGRYLPALFFTWFASRWVDRWPRRSVAVAADVVCAATMVALTLVASAHGPLLVAVALAALSSAVARLQSAAALAVAADLVVESQMVRSAAMISTSEAVATAVGPALASVVLVVGTPQAVFALNGLTFAGSAILLLGVHTGAGAARLHLGGAARPAATADRSVMRALWPLLAARTLVAGVYGADVVLLAVVATQQLRQGTAGYGWLLAAAGAGGLAAAAVLRRGSSGAGATRPAVAGMALYTLPLLVLALAPGFAGSLAVQAVRGVGCVLVTTTVIASLQRCIPSRVAGAVFGRAHALVMGGTAAGALAAPVLLKAVGLHTTLVVAAVAPFAAMLALLPGLLRFDRGASALVAALDPRVALLRDLALFRDASRRTLYEVADRAVERRVDDGTALVEEGGPSDALYVLVSGRVEVSVQGPQGPVVLRAMSAPGYFGEIGLIHGVPRTATVTSRGPCQVWRLPADAFLSAASQAGLSNALSETVQVRLAPPVGAGMSSPAVQV